MKKVYLVVLAFLVTGCASFPIAENEKLARYHDERRDYYSSIGQPHVADEHRVLAEEARSEEENFIPLMVDLVESFFDDN